MDTATPRTKEAAIDVVWIRANGDHHIKAVRVDFARQLERELIASAERVARLEAALERISHAKPDGLDHSRDVGIIERAADVARQALGGAK